MSQTSRKSSPNPAKKKSSPSTDIASQMPWNCGKTVEVNVIQSNPADKNFKGKKKGKFKAKVDTLKQDSQKQTVNDGSKCKPKYPYMICDEEHYTKDYP